jgi:RNA polymerase sigma-70 factor, ECF subfamily
VEREPDDRLDRALLARIADGDRQALGPLYDTHALTLFHHALALARHRSDAEDLVQTVFVKLATTGAELLGVRIPRRYLHRMLKAAWLDDRRRREVRREDPLDAIPLTSATPAAGSSRDALDLARAIGELSPEQREVIVLHTMHGYSLREVGAMTHVSLFTAASRYRLARARLRRLLDRSGGR